MKKNFTLSSVFLLTIVVFFSCSNEDSVVPVDTDIVQADIFEIQQLSSNIYVISEDFAGNNVNITVLTGESGNLLIDTGFRNVCGELKNSITTEYWIRAIYESYFI
jgi:hypothetical protein